jgi:hypothetical protein
MNSESAGAARQNLQEVQVDEPYTYGRPASTYLPVRAVVRLTILRSKLEAVRDERSARFHLMNERAA